MIVAENRLKGYTKAKSGRRWKWKQVFALVLIADIAIAAIAGAFVAGMKYERSKTPKAHINKASEMARDILKKKGRL